MLIRTADLLDLAQAFPASGTRPVFMEPIFFLVRGSMLEAHRGAMHARVPLCVWARDRVIGWGVWKALPDARHAPETMDLEPALRLVEGWQEPVQTRAVFEARGDRRGYVDALLLGAGDTVQALDVPASGLHALFPRLDLAWAPRAFTGGSPLSQQPFGVSRFNVLLRTQPPEDVRGKLPAKLLRLLGGERPRIAVIPDAWLVEPIRVLPHRDGLALVGDRWWSSFGHSFEPLRESTGS